MKAAVSTILLLFVAASFVYLVVGGRSAQPDATDEPVAPVAPATEVVAVPQPAEAPVGEEKAAEAAPPKFVAYYFHGEFRCKTCLAMERFAREAIAETFADELKQGAIEWQAINYDQPENAHYIKTYDLSASALVVAATVDGSPVYWRNLGLIWDLVGDEFAYKAYVINEIEEMMEEGS